MITTHPVQEIICITLIIILRVSEPVAAAPLPVTGKVVTRLREALAFYETAKAYLIEKVESHKRGIQNVIKALINL